MVDHLARTTNDAGQRPDTSFLTLALEALLRLTELYAAERNIRSLPTMSIAQRVGGFANAGFANANPVRSADTSTAASSISVALAEPPERSGAGISGPQPGEQDDKAVTSRRGGWTRGNSTSKQIRDGAIGYLRQKGSRAKGREIYEALKSQGMVINSKDPSALVSSRIGRSRFFDHTYEGYGLVEWSRGDTAQSSDSE